MPGNPSTALYKFNMIGVSNPKQTSLVNDQGKRMFVNLDGHSTIDGSTGTFCSVDTVQVERKSGKPQVYNVSKALLTTCVDVTGDGICDKRIFLFDDSLLDYAWSVDNNGLRVAQFYFFPIAQNIGLTP